MRCLFAFPLFAVMATAIEFIYPKEHSKVKPGEKLVVKWDFVDTDPKFISLYLVNFVDFPPSYVPLAIDIDTHDGHRKIKIPFDTDPSWGYQINAIKDNNLFVIEAQTSHFAVIDRHDHHDHHDRHDRHDRHERHRKHKGDDDHDDHDSDYDSDDDDHDDHNRHGKYRHRMHGKHDKHRKHDD